MTPPRAAELYDRFLARYQGHTRRAYAGDLGAFAGWCGAETIPHALSRLLSQPAEAAFKLAERYKRSLAADSDATLRRRMSTLRNYCRFAHESGALPWLLAVNSRVHRTDEQARAATARDMSGPPQAIILELRQRLQERATVEDLRDLAIVDLHFYRGLRRGELVGLDVRDVNVVRKQVRIRGKGRSVMETLGITALTAASIERWLSVRPGPRTGSLFVRLDRGGRGQGRLSETAVYGMLARRAAWMGFKGKLRPHGLRHSAITSAIVRAAKSGTPLASVQAFARHKSFATTSAYLNKSAIDVQAVMDDLPK